MARLDGKVALISGGARGQGRSHAIRLAEEGADIVTFDLCAQIESVPYEMSTEEDLNETVRMIEDLDQRIVARKADVRDFGQVESVVEECLSEFGHIDIVCANAGIFALGAAHELSRKDWNDVIDVNLTGVWRTCKAVIPHMIERGQGGSIVITSSTAGIKGYANTAHYTASKHGVLGLARTMANELAPHMIRVNTIHPTSVDTPMIQNEATYRLFRPDLDHPTREDASESFQALNALPIPWVEARDISNAVLWLASDESRYVTGIMVPVDAGMTQKV